MSTATTQPVGSLEENAQALVDARLDTIERMLLGQVSRGDRLAIVREVEAQIHDLLAERNPNDTDRDAVIATLARLDPPEAYLPDGAGFIPRTNPVPRAYPTSPAPRLDLGRTTMPSGTMTGKISGVLGIISLFLLLVTGYVLSVAMSSNHPGNAAAYTFFASAFITLVTSVLTVTLAAYSRFQGTWAVVGLTNGIISFLLSLGAGLFALM